MTRLEMAAIGLLEAHRLATVAEKYQISSVARQESIRSVHVAFDRLREVAADAASDGPFKVAGASQMLGRAVKAQGQCIEELALMLVAIAKTLPESEAKPLRDQLGNVLDRAKLVTDEALEAVG